MAPDSGAPRPTAIALRRITLAQTTCSRSARTSDRRLGDLNLTMLRPDRPRTFGEDKSLTISGQRIRVNVSAGVGVPFVMCNGIGAALEVLDPLVDWIEPDIPVVRFDVPGTGESPNTRLHYGFGYLAWLLERVLDELGIG